AFGIAQTTTRMALQLYFATVPNMIGGLVRILPLNPDVRVFGFLLAAAFGTTLAFGLAPALQAARANVNFRRSRLRSALVVSQVAVCALLLIVSGILLKGSRKLETYNPGYETHKIFNLQLQNASEARVVEKLLLERWVESAATVAHPPVDNQPSVAIGPAEGAAVRAGGDFGSPEFFGVLRIAVVRGRPFSRDEANAEAPVGILSQC